MLTSALMHKDAIRWSKVNMRQIRKCAEDVKNGIRISNLNITVNHEVLFNRGKVFQCQLVNVLKLHKTKVANIS